MIGTKKLKRNKFNQKYQLCPVITYNHLSDNALIAFIVAFVS